MRFKEKKIIKDMNNSYILQKLLNNLIKKGKKERALKYFLITLGNLKNNKQNLTPSNFICKTLLKIQPALDVQRIRKGRRIYYMPRIINTEQKINLAINWIIKSVNIRKEKTIEERLYKEFTECFEGKGFTLKKKQTLSDTLRESRPYLYILRARVKNQYLLKKKK